MTIEQIYTGCLAQGAYYIESAGEAVIIDPLREVQLYLNRAARDGAAIKYVLETHFHADFVSGHLELAASTDAIIVYGPTAQPTFPAHVAHDGEVLSIGHVTIEVLHTPGHTLESTTYLLRDETGKPYAIFSGDTLFLGDVGRPDLAQQAAHMTQEELAGLLYDSLRNRLLPLPDHVIVYPGHGAGSACGKHMSAETVGTLGHQKRTNYALRADQTRAEFIREVTQGLLPPPAYFPANVHLNKTGYPLIARVLAQGLTALTPTAFDAKALETGALVLDTRPPEIFGQGFVPGAINIGLDGSFAPWVGALVPDVAQSLLLITDPGREEEAVTRLARVGYDQSLGFLAGGIDAWQAAGYPLDTVESAEAAELAALFAAQKPPVILDVRKTAEFETEAVEGALSAPLDYLNDYLTRIPNTEPVYVYCAGGYRSMIAYSILQARGWRNLLNVTGGFQAIKTVAVPIRQPIAA
jgi:hydroxyacylglutathione hydrolase